MEWIGETADYKNEMALRFEPRHQPRAEYRALTHTRAPVQNKCASRENLRTNCFDFLFAAKEQTGIPFGVVIQKLVWSGR
jgi:hypothetical protein